MSKAYPFKPDYAVAPGETLREMMLASDMTFFSLTGDTGVKIETLISIVDGVAQITPDIAAQLARATSVPARMWLKMEANYRRQLAKAAERSAKGEG